MTANPWNVSQYAAALHSRALVWDNHMCVPFNHTKSWLPQLSRCRESGINFVSLNIGDANTSIEQQRHIATTIRDWISENTEEFQFVTKVDDIYKAQKQGRLAISFDLEGVYAIGENQSLIKDYYELGVRWMLLVYNTNNSAGYGCHDTEDAGLSQFGFRIIEEMDKIGMVKCCSHTGFRTAMDILEASSQPVIFSHSNPAAIKKHPRNIPDELMLACAETGGVVGINGVGIFLGDNNAGVEALTRAIDYSVQLIGPEHVGLGLDYVFNQSELNTCLKNNREFWPEEFEYHPGIEFFPPERLPKLSESLLQLGYCEEDILNILGKNFLRVASRVWK